MTETDLAKNQKMWYTYDELKRVTKRRLTNLSGTLIKEENFTYDAAGNIESTNAWYEDQNFVYDSNNKLIEYNGQPVTYDADGNMLSATITCMNRSFEYDSANRLVKADAYRYIYDGEDVRIKSVYYTTETEYVFNTNAKLSQLLQKSTNGVITKYVYGLGLIGEEKFGTFKTYHFDYRGSTTAITDIYGNITDTFSYDTYGNLLSRSGYYTDTPFMYNGRDGVMTDNNGLIYMRARYYCPELRRFINADILHGEISDSTSLNRYSYVNGNPVSFVDPFGLIAERNGSPYGSIVYNGVEYPIYVPNHIAAGHALSDSWKTIDEITQSDFDFSWAKFFAGIQFDDVNGLANGTNPYQINKQQKTAASALGIFNGLLTSAANSNISTFINFLFQTNGEQRRVIIKTGSSEVEQMYNNYATGVSTSAYFSNAGSPLSQAVVSSYAEELYKEKTGNSTKWYHTYDIEVTVDKQHKGSKYASYLWINSDNTIMETPIIYSNDKVVVGRRSGILGFGFEELVQMPINSSSPVSEEYQKLFNAAFK